MNCVLKIKEHDQTMKEVVDYEYNMLKFSFEKLKTITESFERNIFLEAFLLHSRNLIDFLEASGQKDDLLVTDFNGKNCQPLNVINLNLDKELKQKINKHLHHLSKRRLKDKFLWDTQAIYDEIAKGMNKFYAEI